MEEYNIWQRIFEEDNEIKLEALIRLVIDDSKTADLIFNNLLDLKSTSKKVVKLNINIDKSLEDFPADDLIEKISSDIRKQLDNNL